MAPLNPAHWEVITSQVRSVLGLLAQQTFIARFYLAGGTALAMQLGHRRSFDLDFFSETDHLLDSSRREIVTALARKKDAVQANTDGTLLLQIGDVGVSFFSYGYPLVQPTVSVAGVALASVRDIGLMKVDAIMGRSNKKDFCDLYFVCQVVPLGDLLELGQAKYAFLRDFGVQALKSLTDFRQAEADEMPEMVKRASWDEVKRFFIAQAKALGWEWFGS
jgi:hypothetical protein